MNNNQKRKWTPRTKLEIVLEGVASNNVAEVCRRHGISANQYYEWKNKLYQKADEIYKRSDEKVRRRREAKLEETIQKKDTIIAEITGENLELKKKLWP